MRGVRVSPEDRDRKRVMLVDADRRVLCVSTGRGALTETLPTDLGTEASGVVRDGKSERVTAFYRTPGYEIYRGLGWYGVIVQDQA